MAKRYLFATCQIELNTMGHEAFLRKHRRSPRLVKWVQFIIAQDRYSIFKQSLSSQSYNKQAFKLFVLGEDLTVGQKSCDSDLVTLQFNRFLAILQKEPTFAGCYFVGRKSQKLAKGKYKYSKYIGLIK